MQEKIKAIIEQELSNAKIDNAHGINAKNINNHLIEPILEEYLGDKDDTFLLWTVLEELPETKDGYKIVYDEDTGKFGLAILSNDDKKLYLGIYGNFLTALNAM